MELHQLRYAAEVHRRGSFTAAADALHVSQSGVSAQVAKLERELGVRLFTRRSRAVAPTPDGAALLPQVTTALQAVARIHTVADELTGMTRGQVRIGTVIGCTIPGYLSAFAAFRQEHPGVEVSAVEGNSDSLLRELSSGDLDIVLVAHAEPLPSELSSVVLIDEPIAAAVPSGHPWASRSAISAEDLVGEQILTLPLGTGIRGALEQTCNVAGVEVTPAVQVHSPDAVLELAKQGVGIAVLSTSMMNPDLHTVEIAGACHASLSLATHSTLSAAARSFADLLRAHFHIVG